MGIKEYLLGAKPPLEPSSDAPTKVNHTTQDVTIEVALSTHNRHVAWQNDCITASTGGESMRISTVRQLSRMLGMILADLTENSAQSKALLNDVLVMNQPVSDYAALLNMTVEAIVRVGSFEESTPAVARSWTAVARENRIRTSTLIRGLVAVTRDSCAEMLRDLLSKPADADSNKSMDGSMSAAFTAKGEVKEISINLLSGHFSRAFERTLRASQSAYTERLQKTGGLDETPATPEQKTTSVVLTIGNYYARRNDMYFFNVTSADFIQAYIAATFEYAAGAYADRVRTGRGGFNN